MKILLLCFLGLLAVVGLVALVLFTKLVSACASYQENDSDLMAVPRSCPEISPRKTGQVTRDQKIFVSGYALGAITCVTGAWLILKLAL